MHHPVKDLTGSITGEIIAVGTSCQPSAYLFTMNIYSTTTSVVINGSEFSLRIKLDNRKNVIQEVNSLKGPYPKQCACLIEIYRMVCLVLDARLKGIVKRKFLKF